MPIKIIRQDITKIKCDAVVNPTDIYLSGSGGTDAAIHKSAGSKLDEHCKQIGMISVGESIVTPSYNMPFCKYIIHVVGPRWENGLSGEHILLRSCYLQALKLAAENQCESVALPLISSGTYGCPKETVLRVAIDAISEFLEQHEMNVYVLVYDKNSYSISKHLQEDIESFIDDHYVDDYERARREQRREIHYTERMMGSFSSPKSREIKSNTYCLDERLERKESSDECSTFNGSLLDLLDRLDKGFSETLFAYIDKKGISDVEAYKRSNVSRKVFSKIKCTPNYTPSKITAISFAIGLRLNIRETKDLLASAGMCLSRSSKFDVIIEYFITTGKYNSIHDVNEVLYQYDQSLLGV